ncbi:MAG: adenosylcobinamide amidohydrolase [Rhodothermaceae bacterium]
MTESKYYKIRKDKSFVAIEFTEEQKCLSSAIFNGGSKKIASALILKVEENFKGEKTEFENPEITVKKFGDKIGIKDEFAGMMTSASMNSFREVKLEKEDVVVSAMLTAGFSNAKRAGEKAEWQSFEQKVYKSGTINIILYTNLNLSNAALTEAIMIITEAKTAALQDLNVRTPDNNIATGTGTDSVAVVCNTKGIENHFCGKHTLLGEMIGKAVYQALISSQDF